MKPLPRLQTRPRAGKVPAPSGAIGQGLVALAIVVLGAGCSRAPGDAGTPPQAPPSAASTVPAVADTARPDFPDAAPGDRQLPDPVRLALRRPLESWTVDWRRALPTLRLDQFARAERRSFSDEEPAVFNGNLEGADLRLLYLALPSPDVLIALDPYLGLELGADGELVRAVRGDEPGAVLLDLRQKTERKVLALPAGAWVDGAHWIDATRAVMLVDEPARGGRRPALYLIDLSREEVTRFAGPVAGEAASRGARAELDRRFRAARPELVF